MAKKRITELATETTLKDGQYVAIDHTTDGTKKLNLGAELTDLKEDLNDVREGFMTLDSSDFKQAQWVDGQGITSSSVRLVSSETIIPVKVGQKVDYVIGANNQLSLKVCSDITYKTALQQQSTWQTADGTFEINQNGYLLVVVRNDANNTIVPSDFVSTINIYNIYPSIEIQAFNKKFDNVIDGETVRGLYISNGTIQAINNGCVAVYPVEAGATYKVVRNVSGGANRFRLAFGDVSASNLANGSVDIGFLDRLSWGDTQVITNVFGSAYLYVDFAISAILTADDAVTVTKYNPSVAHFIDYYNLDANLITGDSCLSWTGTKVLNNVPVTGQTCFLETKKTLNNIIYQDIWYPTVSKRYFRQRGANGTWFSWNEIQTKSMSAVMLNYVSPIIANKAFSTQYLSRTRTVGLSAQDIAVYNGTVFDFIEGQCSINNGALIPITNGHGNNAMFGTTLHGDYPYLYCGSWNKDDAKVYVNQYSNGAFTLVNTINYPTLTGYMNCCVDEANERVYMLVAKTSTELGDINFVVGDFSGNIISEKSIGYLPYIEGMTFFKGAIIVTAGHTGVPNSVSVYNTDGELLSKTATVDTDYPIEGIDVDNATGKMYIATTRVIMTD